MKGLIVRVGGDLYETVEGTTVEIKPMGGGFTIVTFYNGNVTKSYPLSLSNGTLLIKIIDNDGQTEIGDGDGSAPVFEGRRPAGPSRLMGQRRRRL